MSRNIPFPPVVRDISAKNASASYKASLNKRGSRTPVESVEEGYGAYRTPDGKIRPAYDLYKADHPAGAEPGLAKVRLTPVHSVNGYEGYNSHAFDFVPARELTRSAPLHDPEAPQDFYANLAVALVTHEGRSALLWAIEDAQFAEWENAIPKGAKLKRLNVYRESMSPGDAPGAAIMVAPPFSASYVIVASGDLELQRNLPGGIKEISGRSGWQVFSQTGLDLPSPDQPNGKDRIGLLNTEFQREIMIPEYGKPIVPHGVMLRPGEQLRFASIRMGDTDPVMIWAYDDAALDRRIANTLLEADEQARRFGHFDTGAEAVIAEFNETLPGLDIRKGRGGSHMAWGYEPGHIAIGTEISSGHNFGFASSNEDHLCQIGADLMAPEAETCDIDDLDDLRWKPEVQGRFEILDMPADQLALRKEAFRVALQAHRNPTPELS